MSSVTFSVGVGGDGSTVTDDDNATTGLANGGHRTRFVPCLSQTVAVAANTVTKATEAAASAATATAAQNSAGIRYDFSTTTTMADPGAGTVRFNNATISSATAIAFDATSADTGNPSVSSFINTWDDSTNAVKGYITFRKLGTPSFYATFYITAITDNTGWLQATVTYVAGNSTLSNADQLVVQFSRSGDAGSGGDVYLTSVQTLTNKTFTDDTTYFQDNGDNTRKMQFQLSGISSGQTRTLTVPNASGTIALTSDIPAVTVPVGSILYLANNFGGF